MRIGQARQLGFNINIPYTRQKRIGTGIGRRCVKDIRGVQTQIVVPNNTVGCWKFLFSSRDTEEGDRLTALAIDLMDFLSHHIYWICSRS